MCGLMLKKFNLILTKHHIVCLLTLPFNNGIDFYWTEVKIRNLVCKLDLIHVSTKLSNDFHISISTCGTSQLQNVQS
jgi:hypothetical protein